MLKKEISKIDGVVLNSNQNSIPHIVNMSVLGIKPETMLHALEEYDIYISTKTACSDAHIIPLSKAFDRTKSLTDVLNFAVLSI